MNTLGEAAVDIHNLPLSSETGSYPQLECIKIDLLYALLGEQIYSTDIQTGTHTHTNRNTHTHTHTQAYRTQVVVAARGKSCACCWLLNAANFLYNKTNVNCHLTFGTHCCECVSACVCVCVCGCAIHGH